MIPEGMLKTFQLAGAILAIPAAAAGSYTLALPRGFSVLSCACGQSDFRVRL